MKRILCVLLSTVLMLLYMPTMAEDVPVDLTIKIRHIGYDSDCFNVISEELNKRCNVNVVWDLSPSENYSTQCTMVLAGNEYPDAMEYAGTYPTDIETMAQDGIIIPLDDLLAEYGKNILEVRSDDYLWYTAKDGHIYSISCRQQEYSNHVYQFRQDWLYKLNLDMPTNLDEFYNVLKAFQDNSDLLVGEGKTLIPYGAAQGGSSATSISGLTDLVYGAYGFINNWNDVDGHATYYINHPNFKAALSYIRKLYQEGLIDSEWPLMNREQALTKWYANTYGVFFNLLDNTDPAFHIYIPIYLENNPDAKLSYMTPFPAEDGKGRITFDTTWNQMVIFSDTTEEQRIALMKLFDYMISPEGSDLVEMGIEGQNWSDNGDGTATFFTLETDQERADLGYYSFNWCMKRNYFPRWNNKATLDAGALYKEHLAAPCIIARTPAQDEFGTTLNDLVNSSITALICDADIDFDVAFNEFVTKWNEYGGSQWTAEMDAVYQSKKQ